MSLKGVSAQLNFPEFASSLPRPVSLSTRDIQTAAAAAAAAWRNRVPPCADEIVRASGEEQGRSIEREDSQQVHSGCDGECMNGEHRDYSGCEAMDESRGQCEQSKEERHSPVPGTDFPCEQGEHSFESISCVRAGGLDFFDEEMRYVFADMAEAMLIPPPLHPAPTGGSNIIVDEDDSNWDLWLWNHDCSEC